MKFSTLALRIYRLAQVLPNKELVKPLLQLLSAKALRTAKYHANYHSPRYLCASVRVAQANKYEAFVVTHGSIFIEEMLKEIRNRFNLDENWQNVFDFFMTLVEKVPEEILEELVCKECMLDKREKMFAAALIMYYALYPEPALPAQMSPPPRPLSIVEFEPALIKALCEKFGLSQERLEGFLAEFRRMQEVQVMEKPTEKPDEDNLFNDSKPKLRDMPIEQKLEALFDMASDQALQFMSDNLDEISSYLESTYEVEPNTFESKLQETTFQRQFEDKEPTRLTNEEMIEQAYNNLDTSEPEASIIEEGGLPSFVTNEDELLNYAAGKVGTPEEQEQARTYFQQKYTRAMSLCVRLVLASRKLKYLSKLGRVAQSEIHPRVQEFWKTIRQPSNFNFPQRVRKHPFYAVYGPELSEKAYQSYRGFRPRVPTLSALARIMKWERAHKEELEKLAIKIVSEVWNCPPELLEAHLEQPSVEGLTTQESEEEEDDNDDYDGEGVSPDEIRDEINKRISLNTLTQGAALHQMITIHHLGREAINKISPDLLSLYDDLVKNTHQLYWQMYVDPSQTNAIAQAGTVGKEELVWNDEGEVKVVAYAIIFPYLLQELSKGVMDVLTTHGLSSLPHNVQKKVIEEADRFDEEQWLIQIGPELWKQFLKVIPRNISLSEIISEFSTWKPQEVEDVIEAVIDNPDKAREILSRIVKPDTSRKFDDEQSEY